MAEFMNLFLNREQMRNLLASLLLIWCRHALPAHTSPSNWKLAVIIMKY